jgi:hypothetical protein
VLQAFGCLNGKRVEVGMIPRGNGVLIFLGFHFKCYQLARQSTVLCAGVYAFSESSTMVSHYIALNVGYIYSKLHQSFNQSVGYCYLGFVMLAVTFVHMFAHRNDWIGRTCFPSNYPVG